MVDLWPLINVKSPTSVSPHNYTDGRYFIYVLSNSGVFDNGQLVRKEMFLSYNIHVCLQTLILGVGD